MRFNPPPGWPPPPDGFVPDPGWQPDPSWPPAPPGWQLWVADEPVRDAGSGRVTPGQPGSGEAPTSVFYSEPPAWDSPAPSGGGGLPPGQPGFGPASGGAGFTQPPVWGPPPGSPGYPAAVGQAGYGPPPGWIPPYQPTGTSGMAIASLVLGLVGLIFVPCAIVAIVLGIVALYQIRRTGQRGRGQAITGIVTGSLWLAGFVVLIVALVLAASSAPKASNLPHAAPSAPETVDPFTLATGDCFDFPTLAPGQLQNINSVVQTPCSVAHNAQVYSIFSAGSQVTYPGTAKLHSLAVSGCVARASALDRPKLTKSMEIQFLFPQQGPWLVGRHSISCIISNPTKTLTSSLLKS